MKKRSDGIFEPIGNYIEVVIGSVSILALILMGSLGNAISISDGILGITGLVILWYTRETSQIRKAENVIAEASQYTFERHQQPVIGCEIFTNPDKPFDTRLLLTNLSDNPLAAQVNCNFRIDEEPIENYSSAYDGTEYWNLQYKGLKRGHFSWLTFYLEKGLISESKRKEIREGDVGQIKTKTREYLKQTFELRDPPKLTMDIEVYCQNEKGYSTYYPPVHYDYNPYRMQWVPTLTSKKPYWLYDSKPSWTNV